MWKVTFDNVLNPCAMQTKIKACKFYTRHDEPRSVEVVDSTVVMTIPADKTRTGINQACTQTLMGFGKCGRHTILYVEAGTGTTLVSLYF